MKLWTHPANYAGATWEGWYVFLVQHRDSDCLTRSNFRCALKALEAIMSPDSVPNDPDESATVLVVQENHWAVGWVEWIAVHPSDVKAVALAEEMEARLENYPILDEDDFSELEMEEANEVWKNFYTAPERLAYIRAHRGQFEFHCFSDMLGCVRGNYFASYSSELLS